MAYRCKIIHLSYLLHIYEFCTWTPVKSAWSDPGDCLIQRTVKYQHGEKFGGTARLARRTVALNTLTTSRTPLLIKMNHYLKLDEPLRETFVPTVLSQALSSVWGNQCYFGYLELFTENLTPEKMLKVYQRGLLRSVEKMFGHAGLSVSCYSTLPLPQLNAVLCCLC